MTRPLTHPEEHAATRKVLFLHSSAEYRGADRTLLQLVAALDRTRWSPVVALPRRGPLIGKLEELGCEIEVGQLGVVGQGFGPTGWLTRALRLPLVFFFVWRMVRRHRPTVVHTTSTAVRGGARAARLLAPRHIWHVHEVLPAKGLARTLAARRIRRLASSVVCSSTAARDALIAALPSLGDRTSVVRNTIDPTPMAAASAARDAVRDRFNVEDDTTLILVVGPLKAGGGHADVVESVESLRYSHPDVRVLVVADATNMARGYVQSLDALVESKGLSGVVSRVPADSKVAELYAAADVVCVPRHGEDPFHVVALESMAAGRPIIATDLPGTNEYVRNGETGLLYTAGDVQRLAWCIGSFAGDRNRCRIMGDAARALQSSEFLLPRFKNEIDRVWSATSGRKFVLPAQRARIVHVVLGRANPERLNGVNYVVHSLATTQQQFGLSVEVWGLTQDPEAPTLPRAYGTSWFQRKRFRFAIPGELRAAIEDLDTTAVVHLHGAFLPELSTVARHLRRRGVPYVVSPHGAYLPAALEKSGLRKRVWHRLFGRRYLRGARAIQALSGRELVAMERFADVGRVSVVPNGQSAISAPVALPPEAADAKRPLFCFCGRLVSRTKGLDVLLEGFARYVAARGSGSLWLIGDGEDRAALEAQAEELGITRRVTFFGALFGDEKHARVAAADAFVHPSRHEGMPTAVLEAAALARPVLVTPGTNLDADVRGAHAGFVIPEVTPEAVAEGLGQVQTEASRGTLAGYGQNAAWLVATRFGWSRIAALVARELYGLDGIADPDAPHPAADSPPPDVGDFERRSA